MTRLAGVAAELVAMRRIFTHHGTDILIVFDTNTQHSVSLSFISPLSHIHTYTQTIQSWRILPLATL